MDQAIPGGEGKRNRGVKGQAQAAEVGFKVGKNKRERWYIVKITHQLDRSSIPFKFFMSNTLPLICALFFLFFLTGAWGDEGGPNGGWAPLFSPDGNQIAFLSSSMHMPGRLWVMDSDGKNVKRVTESGVENFTWSRDGRTLLYSRWGTRSRNIWSIAPTGSFKPVKVPGVPEDATLFRYSPDRKIMAFTRKEGHFIDLWVAKGDGRNKTKVTEKLFIRSLDFVPDGKSLIFATGRTYGQAIWNFDLSKGEVKNISRGFCGNPSISPDGGRIAYVFPRKKKDVERGKYGIRVMDISGDHVKEYAVPHLDGTDVVWAPGGLEISFLGPPNVRKSSGENPHGRKSKEVKKDAEEEIRLLWLFDLKNEKERRITPDTFSISGYTWSLDGKEVVVSGGGKESYASELWVVTVSSGNMAPLVKSRYAEWFPAPSPTATRVAFVSNRNRMGMVLVADDSGNLEKSFDPFPLSGEDRLAFLANGKVLFLYNPRGFRFLDLGEKTRLHLQLSSKFKILELQPSLVSQKILLNGIRDFRGKPEISLLTGGGEEMKEIGMGGKGVELQPRWSFNGEKIAYVDGVDLFVMKKDGQDRRRLTGYRETNGKGRKNPSKEIERRYASDPFWSPDGKSIGFISTVYGEGENPLRQIRVVSPRGGKARKIYEERIDPADQVLVSDLTTPPFFTIDGDKIIFTSIVGKAPNLVSLDMKDGKKRILTRDGALFPALLPENEEILYTSLKDENERVMIMEIDGSGKRPFLVDSKKDTRAISSAYEGK